jgi:type IV secretion system protein VirB10
MSEQNTNPDRDPALDTADAEFDREAYSGSIDGPGLVTAHDTKGAMPLHAAPPKTKALSTKGGALLMGSVVVVAAGIVVGVLSQNRLAPSEPRAAGASGGATVATAAPSIDALNRAAEQAGQGGQRGSDLLPPANGGQRNPPPTDPLAGGAGGAGTGPTTPSHREQYLDWLERHRYDQLRARHMAAAQAQTAPVIGDSARNMQASGGRQPQQMAAAAPQGMPTPVAYTGQPRPDRVPPELLAQLAQAPAGQRPPAAGMPAGSFAGFAPQGGQGQQNRAAQMEAFAESSRDVGYLDQQVRDARPGHEVAAGSIIPAVMLSGINSDLPGSIVAQVRSDVFSTFDFNTLLIPAGSRLIGRYSSDVATGQERVLIAWDELIFPSGRRISLEGMGAVDGQGAAGMRDQVNTHFWRIWGNALMISAIGVAVQQSQPRNATADNTPTSSQQAAAAAANSLNETAQQVLRRNLNISPTLQIRPGYTFSVMVNRSISLPAYRD